MGTDVHGKAKTRKRSVARDLTARKTTTLTCGILYNGHAGLGSNAVSAVGCRPAYHGSSDVAHG